MLEIDTFGICQPWQLKFLRPYVNTELQQIPNLSRYTNIAYLHIDYGFSLLSCVNGLRMLAARLFIIKIFVSLIYLLFM